MVRGHPVTGWADGPGGDRHPIGGGLVGILALLLVWEVLATGMPRGAAAVAEGPGSRSAEVGQGTAGRHFIVVTGGGDTAYLAVGTTSMSLPPGTMVSFDPLRVRTSLDRVCPRWHLMARFGGRTVGDTRVVAGTRTSCPPVVQGAASYLVVRPEPMTWAVGCYDDEGGPMALPGFTAHIEFHTATPFS